MKKGKQFEIINVQFDFKLNLIYIVCLIINKTEKTYMGRNLKTNLKLLFVEYLRF